MGRDQKRRQKLEKRRKAKLRAETRRAGGAEGGGAGRAAQAEEALERADEAREEGQLELAEKLYRKAVKLAPRDAAAFRRLASLLQSTGRHEAAVACAQRAVEAAPEDQATHFTLAGMHRLLGQLQESRGSYRRAVELQPDHGRAWHGLSTVKRWDDPADADLAAMKDALRGLSRRHPDLVPLHFALAKAYEDLGQYDLSFKHLKKGNHLKRLTFAYDVAQAAGLFTRTANQHGAAFLERGPAAGAPQDRVILIVGMPRSGSSLVEQILASHSEVVGIGEVVDLDDSIRECCPEGNRDLFPEATAELDDATLAAIGDRYVQRLRHRAPGARRLVDKCLANYQYLGLVHRCLPNARIIHCQRHPVDTCLGCYRILFTVGVPFAYDLRELGQRYQIYAQLMQHWRGLMPDRFLDFRYEELVQDPEGQTRLLLEHCGLPWEDACLRFHETPRAVVSASAVQVRSPIFKTSLAKWRRYGSNLKPLVKALGPCAPQAD